MLLGNDGVGLILPTKIIRNIKKKLFENEISYDLETAGITGEIKKQDARFMLPVAAETKIIMTQNIRSLFNLFENYVEIVFNLF